MPRERTPRSRAPRKRRTVDGADVIRAQRREMTLELKKGGASYREIVAALDRQGVKSSVATVKNDLDALTEEYREEAFRSRETQMILDLQRLETMLSSVWVQATNAMIPVDRRVDALKAAMDVIKTRSQMLAYDELSMRETTDSLIDAGMTPEEEAKLLIVLDAMRAGRDVPFFDPARYQLGPAIDGVPPPPPPPTVIDATFTEITDGDPDDTGQRDAPPKQRDTPRRASGRQVRTRRSKTADS